jgi:hypothetical protein
MKTSLSQTWRRTKSRDEEGKGKVNKDMAAAVFLKYLGEHGKPPALHTVAEMLGIKVSRQGLWDALRWHPRIAEAMAARHKVGKGKVVVLSQDKNFIQKVAEAENLPASDLITYPKGTEADVIYRTVYTDDTTLMIYAGCRFLVLYDGEKFRPFGLIPIETEDME